MRSLSNPFNRARLLQFQQLELRENPTANLVTSVSGGVLTLTGTDESESFTIAPLSGNLFTITGQSGTTIDGASSKTTTIAANSIRMNLKGGSDSVAIDDTSAALNLTGALMIDGGDGYNSFDFSTITKATSLGSLNVIGGDGKDQCLIGNTGFGTTIAGDVNFSLGLGDSDVKIVLATIGGNYNFKASIGNDTTQLTGSQIAKNVTFDVGSGGSTFTSESATVLGVKSKTIVGGNFKYVASVGDDAVYLTDTQINGATGVTVTLGAGKGGVVTDGAVDVSNGGLSVYSVSDTGIYNKGDLTVKGSTLESSSRAIYAINDGTLKTASFVAKSRDGVTTAGAGSWRLSQSMTLSTYGNLGFVAASFTDVQLGGSLNASSAVATSVDVQSGFLQNVNISSTFAAAQFSHRILGDLNIKGNVSVRATREANLIYSSTGMLHTAGTTTVKSTGSVATFENSNGQMTLTGPVIVAGSVGGLFKLSSPDSTGATIQNNVSLTSSGGSVGATLNALNATMNGKLSMNAKVRAELSSSTTGEIRVAGDFLLSGGYSARMDVENSGNLKLGSKLTINGDESVDFQMNNSGIASSIAGDVSLQTNGLLTCKLSAGGKSFGGNVTIKGNELDFNVNTTGSTSNFAKNLSASTGPTGQASAVMTATYNILGDTTFNFPVGISTINIAGKGTGVSDFGGKLSIQTGDSVDSVILNGVAVTGNVSILTKSNSDAVFFDKACLFGGTVDIDTGSGDDLLTFGPSFGLTRPAVVFNGKTTIRSGSGNDIFSLGLTVAGGGDSNSVVMFNAPGSILDGGIGFDIFTDTIVALPLANLTILGF